MTRLRVYAVTIAVCIAVGAVVLISHLVSFIHLFLEHSGISITQEEVKVAHYNWTTSDRRTRQIPKIIHHIYHDWTGRGLPDDWKMLRQSCIDLNPDWEHRASLDRLSEDACIDDSAVVVHA
jgi:mannosyltransferase OCH1-like enzyme